MMFQIRNELFMFILIFSKLLEVKSNDCPSSESILPCRCSQRNEDIQIWCSHSNLPQILEGIKSIGRKLQRPVDELIIENNQLPSMPGRSFSALKILRLMLRNNNIERLSNGWLNDLENDLVEIYIVERHLRSIPLESLLGFKNVEAITIQSKELKRLPDFSGLLSLKYINVQSSSLYELPSQIFKHLPKLETIHINGGKNFNRIEAGLFDNLILLKFIDLSQNGLSWIHLRCFYRLPNLKTLKLTDNHLNDIGMIGRIVKDLESLQILYLDKNHFKILNEGSFVDLPNLKELYLNDNQITEIHYGSFHRTQKLQSVYLQNNNIKYIHPESFLQSSGSGVENLFLQNNNIIHIQEIRSLLDTLPTLKFLDISNNYLIEIPFGALHGHGTLEQLYINSNKIEFIERNALMAMPALRELRLNNNSLSDKLEMPFWNLPGLKGLDLSLNKFNKINSLLLSGLPSLRRFDISKNNLILLDSDTFINNGMLETLNISYNDLNDIHPNTFNDLNRLFEIDASYNHFTNFITHLPKMIERLSLRGNNIISLISPLSDNIFLDLPKLRMLDISYNQLEYLPKSIFKFMQQLRVLSLAYNNLHTIENDSFIGVKNLEILHLNNNQITIIEKNSLYSAFNLIHLNLKDNQIQIINNHLFKNNTNLQYLDISHNNLNKISELSFANQKLLQYLDLSNNYITYLPESLSFLTKLKEINLSYNQISTISTNIIDKWKNIIEIYMTNNQINKLQKTTFRNLFKLKYLDLSSNEIATIEPNTFSNLPSLQELVLADNKLIELKDNVFNELTKLQAIHLQYNLLKFISVNSFHKTISLVYLNISVNNFHNFDNIGIRNLRNLEVLDLSKNNIKIIKIMPLKMLNWLVELNLDDNQICKIEGLPFENMPRLRVLSLRNNRLRKLSEESFKHLRGNLAILDIEGNPIQCSCDMLWFSVWLDETNSPNPGPICENGKLLRSSRMEKSDCGNIRSSDNLQLMNEHGDIFSRQLSFDIDEECRIDDISYNEMKRRRPFPTDSEYFYDQYIDVPPSETHINTETSFNSGISANSLPTDNQDLNNTILNLKNYQNNMQSINRTQSSSPFTFFGYPLPSINVGRFFSPIGRKSDEKKISYQSNSQVRMFPPTGSELQVFLNNDSILENSQKNEQKIFRTPFIDPSIEEGGFTPMTPETFGGFIPIKNPYNEKLSDEMSTTKRIAYTENDSFSNDNMIPVPIQTIQKNDAELNKNQMIISDSESVPTNTEISARIESPIDDLITEKYKLNLFDEKITSSTSGTILLIPPTGPEIKSQFTQNTINNSNILTANNYRANDSSYLKTNSRYPPGKSTITKVFTSKIPHLPTAEEYFGTAIDANSNIVQSKEIVTTAFYNYDEKSRKHGLEWYYKNYPQTKNPTENFDIGEGRSNISSITYKKPFLIIFLLVFYHTLKLF